MKSKIWSFIVILFWSQSLYSTSFIQDINLKHKSISFNSLLKKVSEHNLFLKNYLSLGESHLHPSTSRPVLLNIAKHFLENTNFHKKLCAENISSFLNTGPGIEMKRLSHLVDIYEGNNH
jgi:hypothetical protein